MRVGWGRLAIFGALVAALAATNRWMSWEAGSLLLSARDEMVYRRMALAAPGLPSGGIGNQYAQLFVPNWLVGAVHQALSVPIDIVFRVGTVALMLGICVLLWAALGRASVHTPGFTVCMALLLLNTYSLRYYLIAPGYVTDVGFVFCLAAITFGLVTTRFWLVLGGILAAVLVRQSALPVTLALGALMVWGQPWRQDSPRVRPLRAAAVVVLPWGLFAGLLAVSAPFSISDTPGVHGLTVLGAIEQLPTGAGALGEHVVRALNPMFAIGALLAACLLARRQMLRFTRGATTAQLESLGGPFWSCLILGLSVWLQEIGLNPNYSGHPERLAVLALVPFIVALALALGGLERSGVALPAGHAAAIAVLLGLGSLHYLYTWFGPATATQGGLLQLVTALLAGGLLWHGLVRGRPAPRGPTATGGVPKAPAGLRKRQLAAWKRSATLAQLTVFHHASR